MGSVMVEAVRDVEAHYGLIAPPRFRDPVTATLGLLASSWESLHKTYQAETLRAKHAEDAALRETLQDAATGALALRDAIGKRMARALRKHPLHPWMAEHKWFPKAAHTARLIAGIGDPLRFPGRMCAARHHLPSDFAGEACPVPVYGDNGSEPKACGAAVGPVRQGMGVRSVWHYCGLHVVAGRLPRQRKGQQGTWNPAIRDALMKPDVGIFAQLIRAGGGVQPWRGIYDEAKERIGRERGAERLAEIDPEDGPSPPARSQDDARVEAQPGSEWTNGPGADEIGGGAEISFESERSRGATPTESEVGADDRAESERLIGPALRPFQIDQRARIIAGKAMVGDLLMAWKEAVGRVAR